MVEFEPHGEFSLSTSGRVLTIRATGAFNAEACKKFFHDSVKIAETGFYDEPWGCVMVFKDWFPTHDSIDILKEVNENALRNRRAAIAIVVGEALPKQILKIILGHETHIFTDENEANQWVNNKLIALIRAG
ncbi:hypothetical protein P2G88_03310 [Aliiglaciecola sp. CAU 1673]|uniref:hypothetical protein n=1 Tax=Aliiglaciecola sp. CAU 1673 TaxID=3032595 RepID=UPI0023DADF16|nr:hypothetical protein [Aliiglaciecola sp. CAU 1673]MDF2177270.1 hypothetical protein [Aliiglaciecola sp. CAU 1673]